MVVVCYNKNSDGNILDVEVLEVVLEEYMTRNLYHCKSLVEQKSRRVNL